MKKRLPFCFLFILLIQQVCISQNIPVRGRVTDFESKLPVAGASVLQKGTSVGTITDEKGNFSLSVPSNAVLVISSVNFDALELPVDGKNEIIINLQSASIV